MKHLLFWQRIINRWARQPRTSDPTAGVMLQNDLQSDNIPPCPSCKATDVARIIYGKPPLTRKVLEGLEAGRIVSGGCLVHQGAPAWRCNRCNRDFGRLSHAVAENGDNK